MTLVLVMAALAGPALAQGGDTGRGCDRPGSEKGRALLQAVLEKHSRLRDFEAGFAQTEIGRASGAGVTEKGTVYFKRPDLWRWEYRSPDRKVLIVRGREATLWVEGDAEPSRYELAPEIDAINPGALLSGGSRIGEALCLDSSDPVEPTDEPILRLRPRRLNDAFERLDLRVNARSLQIREVRVVDPGGNVMRFLFSGMRADKRLPEGLFSPPGGPVQAP